MLSGKAKFLLALWFVKCILVLAIEVTGLLQELFLGRLWVVWLAGPLFIESINSSLKATLIVLG